MRRNNENLLIWEILLTFNKILESFEKYLENFGKILEKINKFKYF